MAKPIAHAVIWPAAIATFWKRSPCTHIDPPMRAMAALIEAGRALAEIMHPARSGLLPRRSF